MGKGKLRQKMRQNEAADLAVSGYTYQQIADKLGYAGRQGASQAVVAYFKRHPSDNAENYRNKVLARNERMIQQLYNDGHGTPAEAIDRIIKLQEQCGRWLGIVKGSGDSGSAIAIAFAGPGGAAAIARCADWTESGVAGQLGEMVDGARRANETDSGLSLEAGTESGDPSGNGTGSPQQGPTAGPFDGVPGIVHDRLSDT